MYLGKSEGFLYRSVQNTESIWTLTAAGSRSRGEAGSKVTVTIVESPDERTRDGNRKSPGRDAGNGLTRPTSTFRHLPFSINRTAAAITSPEWLRFRIPATRIPRCRSRPAGEGRCTSFTGER